MDPPKKDAGSALSSPKSRLPAVLLVVIVLVIVLVGAGAILSDFLDDLKSDEIAHRGGRNQVYEWVTRNSVVDSIQQGKIQASPPLNRHTNRFVTWIFGDDFSEYRLFNCHPTSDGVADSGNTPTWSSANSVLLIKLKRAGTEQHQISSGNNSMSFHSDAVMIYTAEAWLVDKDTRQLIAHDNFGPGEVPNRFLADLDSIRFRAVDHAIEWGRSSK